MRVESDCGEPGRTVNFGKLLICKEFVFVAVRRFPPIPACHARGRGLKSCKPLLHSNERRLFGRVYDSAEMALGLASGLAATALQGLPFPTKCDQRVRLDPA